MSSPDGRARARARTQEGPLEHDRRAASDCTIERVWLRSRPTHARMLSLALGTHISSLWALVLFMTHLVFACTIMAAAHWPCAKVMSHSVCSSQRRAPHHYGSNYGELCSPLLSLPCFGAREGWRAGESGGQVGGIILPSGNVVCVCAAHILGAPAQLGNDLQLTDEHATRASTPPPPSKLSRHTIFLRRANSTL